MRKYFVYSFVTHTALFGILLLDKHSGHEKVELVVQLIDQPVNDPKVQKAKQKEIANLFKLVPKENKNLDHSGNGVPKHNQHNPEGLGVDKFHTEANLLKDDKFVYSSFFERVRSKLELIWFDKARAKIIAFIRSQKKRFPFRSTKVIVTLNEKGYLVNINFITESGDSSIDNIALESFREAGNFDNPPKDLIKNGVVIFDWEFIINI